MFAHTANTEILRKHIHGLPLRIAASDSPSSACL
jgi:hypothetical protein